MLSDMNEQHRRRAATTASTVIVVHQCLVGQRWRLQCPFCPKRSSTADRWFQHAEQVHEAELATHLFHFQADLDSALSDSSYVSCIQLHPGASPPVYAYWSVSALIIISEQTRFLVQCCLLTAQPSVYSTAVV